MNMFFRPPGGALHLTEQGDIPIGPLPPFVQPFVDPDTLPNPPFGVPDPTPAFPRSAWDPELHSYTILSEFVTKDWRTAVTFDPPPTDPKAVEDEIKILLELAKLRDSRANELKLQNSDPVQYWLSLLMMTPASHPMTYELLAIALTVGRFVVMDAKRHFNRGRPSQVYPGLMPPVSVPGHPSYPNAHALQGRLMSLCTAEAHPAARAPLLNLASRVGFNREVMGVHFPSDTEASIKAAEQIFGVLKTCLTFIEVLDEAVKEWPRPAAHP